MIVTADPVPAPCNPMMLTAQDKVLRLQATFPSVPSFTHIDASTTWLVFCSPITTVNPAQVPYSNPRVVVELTATSGRFHLEANFHLVKSFTLEGNEEQLHSLIMSLQKDSGYVLCPGLPSSLAQSVTFGSKKLRRWGPMLQRSDHADCLMWYHTSHASTSSMCSKCSRLSYHLQDMIKRKQSMSPATKRKRTSAGSRYPKVYLTPKSLAERVKNEKVQAMADKKAARKVRKFDIDVDNITSEDLIAVVAELERTSKDTLEQLLIEADRAGISLITITWDTFNNVHACRYWGHSPAKMETGCYGQD